MLLEGVLPDFESTVDGEFGVVQTDVVSRVESWVKIRDLVGGQEHNTSMILYDPQEDGHDLVPLELVQTPALQKHIGLITRRRSVH